jgi:hypothetical protein
MMNWLKISGVLIWALIELFRWFERNNLKTTITHDILTKLEEAHREINADVEAAAHDPIVPVGDPNDRDNDNQGSVESRNT